MGKTLVQQITRWDGGISDDVREPAPNKCALVKHFDIYSNPYKLSPYRSSEAYTGTSVSATDMKQYDIRNFQYSSTSGLFGLGKQLGADASKVWMFYASDPTDVDSLWTVTDSTYKSTSAGSVNWRNCFVEWQDKFWTFGSTNKVICCPLDGTWNDNAGTVGTINYVYSNGIIGPDNNLYLFYNNKVVRVSPAGTVTDDVCPALPSDMIITSVSQYQNYLAIGMRTTIGGINKSKVFIWDMVSDTTITDVFDWGAGALMVLGNIEGRLVGVSNNSIGSALGRGAFGSLGSLVIRILNGGEAQVIKELVNTLATPSMFLNQVVIRNNKIHWVCSMAFASSTSSYLTHHFGIWSFGRKNMNSNYALSLEYVEEAAIIANPSIQAFGNAGNIWFIAHSIDGSITKTDDQANYTFTSAYETQKFGDPSGKHKLVRVKLDTEALPTAGQVVLKYKKDEETSYTTIFTNGTDNSLSHSAVNIESTGATLPEFREIQFRIESTGGAEITQLYFEYEELDKDI